MIIHWQHVSSSNIVRVAHFRRRRVLLIEFENGSWYAYRRVPRRVFHELLACDSKGKYLHWRVKPHYRADKVYDSNEPIKITKEVLLDMLNDSLTKRQGGAGERR